FSDMAMYGIVVPVLPSLLEDMVDNVSMSNGLLTGSFALGLLFGAPISGKLSDVYRNRQLPMCIGLGALLLSTIMFSLANVYWLLIVARILQGAASGASWAVGFSMVADVYPPEKAGVAMGTIMGCNTLGHLLGPTLGGVLFEAGGRHAPFIFGACLALVDLLARIVVGETINWKVTHLRSEDGTGPYVEAPMVNLPFTKMIASWRVLAVCMGTFASASVLSGVDPILPLFLESTFNLNPGLVGVVFIALVIPNVIVSPVIGWLLDRFKPNRIYLISLGLVLIGTLSPMITLTKTLTTHVVTLVFLGATLSVALAPTTPELLYYMHDMGSNSYGVVYALFNVVFSLGMFVGPIMAGALYESTSFLITMLALMGLILSVAVVLVCGETYRILFRRTHYPVETKEIEAETGTGTECEAMVDVKELP
ncbi:major facilitator superfamily domain-containing protein, partial [Dimargaris cristalligena]